MFHFNEFTHTLNIIIDSAQDNFLFVGTILGILWLFNLVNWSIGGRLNVLGIYPRSLFGLVGIFFSPLLHGNINHLFFNSIPLFLLINFILINGMQQLYIVTLAIMISSGLLVWLLGRKAFHIGASSLIMGYWGYLIAEAFFHPSMLTIVVASVMLYYLGSLVCNLIPSGLKVSWEGHIFGAVAGIGTALLMQYR
jgi:membrane associated rhomboid family serine protease